MTRRCVLIISLDHSDDANEKASLLDPGDGSDTFGAVRLSESGEEPATHTGCNTVTGETGYAGIQDYIDAIPYEVACYRIDSKLTEGAVYRYDGSWNEIGEGDIWTVALEEEGLEVIQDEII